MSEENKTPEFYEKLFDDNRIAMAQYESLRDNFHKMVEDVLGKDYYNMGMDVYECDRICCEDITRKANRKNFIDLKLLKQNIKNYLIKKLSD